jgi:hypothetical protein
MRILIYDSVLESIKSIMFHIHKNIDVYPFCISKNLTTSNKF